MATSSSSDPLDNFIQFVTEYSTRTEELVRRHDECLSQHKERMAAHDERVLQLKETQIGIQRILDRLTFL